jgi:hypothetical protein
MRLAAILALVTSLASPALSDTPKVVAAEVQRGETGWIITVTLSHPDAGWDHFASGWRVELADGTELGYRELSHPHVDEQPFTRSLSGVPFPDGATEVYVRPRCNMVGWSATATPVTVTP